MTIKQRTKNVPIATATGERTICVRRLAWGAATQFIQALTGVVCGLYGGQAVPGDGFFARLPKLITESTELVALLVSKSTDLKPEEIATLDYGDVLALVDAGLEINLDDEIKNSCSGIAAKTKAFAAAMKTS